MFPSHIAHSIINVRLRIRLSPKPIERADAPTQSRPLVLITSAGFEPGFRAGGPVRSVTRIVDSAPSNIETMVLTRDRDLGSREPYPGLSGRWVSRPNGARVFYLDTRSATQWLTVVRDLRRTPIDLMYLNSFFEPTMTVLAVLAARLRIIRVQRILIAPRGELSSGALSLKSLKKRLFVLGWQPMLRHAHAIWHASSELEAAEILARFPHSQVEVSPGLGPGVSSLPDIQPHDGPIHAVFISRISPKKNLRAALLALLNADKAVSLDIYGPIEDASYWNECEKVIAQLPSQIILNYRGELSPEEVSETFGRYDVFIFPTLGENFGHVIAESLSAGCPVICSDSTPWTSVLISGGGEVLQSIQPSHVASVLNRWASMKPDDRVAARLAAASAYQAWAAIQDGTNILDRVINGRRIGPGDAGDLR